MSEVYPLKARIRAQGDVTRVDVYDDIGEGGWFAEGLTAKSFAAQLASVRGALEVHINSAGGDVFDGISIGNAIRGHKGVVTTVVDGLAASIASVIAQAGHERVVQPGSMLMIHDAYGGCVGDAAEMAKMAETLGQVSDNLAGIYASRAGGTAESWRAAMRAETWYTAEEAVAAGLADRVGDGEAALPAGLDLAALGRIPGRIAARLRTMPQAAASPHGPMTGTHTHPHPAYGSQGSDGSHEHEHSHDGDADHHHAHGDGMSGSVRAGQQSCADMGHQCCRDAGTMDAAGQRPRAEMHGDHVRIDPDGDGDCDACPEGDTDNDWWSEDGEQLQPLPGQGAGGLLGDTIRAIVRQELRILAADKYTQDDRDRMAKSGHAMPDGSYPIEDEEDLDKAIRAVGRGGAEHDAIRRHIIKRAKALGLSERIPDNWNADGSLQDGSGSNHTTTDVSGLTPEQVRAALRGATE